MVLRPGREGLHAQLTTTSAAANPIGTDKQIQSGMAAMGLHGSWMISTFTNLTDAAGKKLDIGIAPDADRPDRQAGLDVQRPRRLHHHAVQAAGERGEVGQVHVRRECQNIIGESGVVFPARPDGTELAIAVQQERSATSTSRRSPTR